jgi:hypothetical protein
MARQGRLAVIESADLPVYPVESDDRLETHYYLTWHHRRWMNSEFRALGDLDVRGAALDLYCAAMDQSPVGTLPLDDRLLAKLVGVSIDQWAQLMKREYTPLYGWFHCLTDKGVICWAHPVVKGVVLDALDKRHKNLSAREADRERKRLLALKDQMIRAGAPRGMAEDEARVARLDAYLIEHYPNRQRRPAVILEAMEALELAAVSAERGRG